MFYVSPSVDSGVGAQYIRYFELFTPSHTGNRLAIYDDSKSSLLRVVYYDVSGVMRILSGPVAWLKDEPHLVALTFNPGGTSLYVDGQIAAFNTHAIKLSDIDSKFYVGSLDNHRQCNCLIDDFAIISRALSADEIRAIYESNAPVFAETSTWQFRATPQGLVWADEEGLWMRTANGDAVLGVYGGEAGGKSWGGQTLDTGDLLIGRSSQYVKWDDSAGQLQVAGSITITGGSGISNISDAGDLATQDTVAWTTDITGRPLDNDNRFTLPTVPGSTAALYAGSDKMGYHDGSAWKTYWDNQGNFFLTGASGSPFSWTAATETLLAAGWQLDTEKLVGGNTTLHKDGWAKFGAGDETVRIDPTRSDNWRFGIGADDISVARFRVDKYGNLVASNAQLTNATVSGTVTATAADGQSRQAG